MKLRSGKSNHRHEKIARALAIAHNVNNFHQAAGGGLGCAHPSIRGRGKMDAKRTRGLVFLAVLSLFCATVAWGVDHAVFGSVFAALSAVAVLGAAAPRHRR